MNAGTLLYVRGGEAVSAEGIIQEALLSSFQLDFWGWI
jgi:hypothetical protein